MLLALQAILVLAVAGYVLAPLVVYRGQRMWRESREEVLRRSITERKARLYGTILDLDFDRDSGKISVQDHAQMRDEAMREILQVLQEEEAVAPAARSRHASRPASASPASGPPRGTDRVEQLIAEYKRRQATRGAEPEGAAQP